MHLRLLPVTGVFCRSARVGVRHAIDGNRPQTSGNFIIFLIKKDFFYRISIVIHIKISPSPAYNVYSLISIILTF